MDLPDAMVVMDPKVNPFAPFDTLHLNPKNLQFYSGMKGDEGALGDRGKVGKTGPIGVAGEKGSKGAPGYAGQDGADGLKVRIQVLYSSY